MAKRSTVLKKKQKTSSSRAPAERKNQGKPHTSSVYNWLPDLPDQRDLPFSEKFPGVIELPLSVDLRNRCSPIFDQGKIGSCTSNALAAAVEFLVLKNYFSKHKSIGPELLSESNFNPVSRLFIYAMERTQRGSPHLDTGSSLRDGLSALLENGVCPEKSWKYASPLVLKTPSDKVIKEARKLRIKEYFRLQNLAEMKKCLASGFPFVFGFSVYESFESTEVAHSGIMPLPEPSESILGGHAALAVGYDDVSEHLIVRNCWGRKWGQQGYFMMPYAYVVTKKLAQDFWTLRI